MLPGNQNEGYQKQNQYTYLDEGDLSTEFAGGATGLGLGANAIPSKVGVESDASLLQHTISINCKSLHSIVLD